MVSPSAVKVTSSSTQASSQGTNGSLVVSSSDGTWSFGVAFHVASTIADLTSRVTQVNAADTTDIFSVGRTIVAPLSTSSLKMRLTSLTSDGANVSRVDWSDASNWTTLTPNAVVVVPAGVISANQSVIRADVQYTYDSPVHYLIPTGIVINQTYYLRPRLSTQVLHN